MMPTIDIFERGKKQTVYFHSMFDSNYFIAWMQKLLESLATINVRNSVIVMDTEKYQQILTQNNPKASCKKQQLVDYCIDNGLGLEENGLKTVIWGRMKLYISDHVKPVVIYMAAEAGHTVIWSPIKHSDLQTIEMVWTNVKGTVGRQYTKTTTLGGVQSRPNSAFVKLYTKTVAGCINKSNNIFA